MATSAPVPDLPGMFPGAACFEVVLDTTIGWATAISGFHPGRSGGVGHLVRGEELGTGFADWLDLCATDPDFRDTLTIIVSDSAPDILGRIRVLGAHATADDHRVTVTYDEVILESAHPRPER